MIEPKKASLVSLAALLPVVGYSVWSPEVSPYIAVVNVIVITASLLVMMGTDEDGVSPV